MPNASLDGGHSRRFGGPLRACALTAVLLASAGCYHLRIDESFWLRARPGPAADTARAAAGLPTGYTVQRFTIPLGNGGSLAALVAKAPTSRTTVLYFGGDDFVVAQQGPAVLRGLTTAPVNVVLVDYPGSGASPGRPTLAALESAATRAYDWVAARPALAPAGVVVHGHSIGSFVAGAVADARPVRGLVLQSSATNPTDWMHSFFRPSRLKWWARPAYPFIRVSIDTALAGDDNLARVRRYRGPLLILSGTADDKAAPEMSRALAEASATPDSLKRLLVLPGAGHEDVLVQPGFAPAYREFIAVVTATAGAARPSR